MKLRIHGDNIIECERALDLINAAYEGELKRVSNCLYLPEFKLFVNKKAIASIELFAGHDRCLLPDHLMTGLSVDLGFIIEIMFVVESSKNVQYVFALTQNIVYLPQNQRLPYRTSNLQSIPYPTP